MIFRAFVLSALVSVASAQETVASTTASPVSTAPVGGGDKDSCAARFGDVYEFKEERCCNTNNFNVNVPDSKASVKCNVAKAQYQSSDSAAWAEAGCSSVKIDIQI